MSAFSIVSSLLEKKMHLQETRLDTPFGSRRVKRPVNHEGGAEAEHEADEVRHSEGPGRSPRAQALLGNLSRVSVAYCRSTSGRECG
jgi:hypothetical protein